MSIRIIPRLDVKGLNLVKGIHPERSGKQGLKVYQNLADMIKKTL